MKNRACLIIALTTLLVVTSVAAGDIQISCEPGLRIYLDGEFQGLSSAREDGLYLMGVDTGQHTIWVEKDGYISQHFEVEILELPIEVRVGEFQALPEHPERKTETDQKPDVHQQVGNLLITSAPQNCTVEIDGASRPKTEPVLALGGLTAGDHVISFSKPGFETISGVVTIQPGADVRVRGNLKKGQVETVHEGKGSLRVISKPHHCKIGFLGKIRDKTDMHLNISMVPAGEHPLLAQYRGQEHFTTVWIKKGQRTIVKVNFMEGQKPFEISYEPE